ncbi:hypothetical protein M0638_04620 [Roseomonas sp. NAR14]|uniref:Uncharacterized protein n=1 Tax=Roseomonas acroporae TaxID=2937791 RepID=A0A9X1Y7I7_9PROT|nr:hypothetical protein [Roseomonas acroporae]MCK8783665.1 hypothetical protein [Roseomonas acroporae]
MLKVAALAFLPAAAVLFGIMAVPLAMMPAIHDSFSQGATLYYGAAALSFILAVPVSWYVARRMLSRRERALLDAGAGRGRKD